MYDPDDPTFNGHWLHFFDIAEKELGRLDRPSGCECGRHYSKIVQIEQYDKPVIQKRMLNQDGIKLLLIVDKVNMYSYNGVTNEHCAFIKNKEVSVS